MKFRIICVKFLVDVINNFFKYKKLSFYDLLTNILFFSCCCKACLENYPLRDDLPDFSEKDYESNTRWAVHR